jgi:DNA-binding transcriptional ArsR family regulator
VQGEPVALQGLFTVRPRVASDASPLPVGRGAEHVDASVRGDARELRVAGQVVLAPLPDAAREAGLAALLAGVAAAGYALLQKGLAPTLFPLYSRLAARDLLGNEQRQRLYDAVAAQPFIHLRDLERASGLGYGCVVYHMHVLKRERLVESVKTPSREFFFVPRADLAPQDMRRLAVLADPTRQRIALVLARGAATHADLARALGMDKGQLTRQLAKLAEAGLVEAEPAGRGRRYRAGPLLLAWVGRDTPQVQGLQLSAA